MARWISVNTSLPRLNLKEFWVLNSNGISTHVKWGFVQDPKDERVQTLSLLDDDYKVVAWDKITDWSMEE